MQSSPLPSSLLFISGVFLYIHLPVHTAATPSALLPSLRRKLAAAYK
ncbi:hypothetical protein [Treponema endosymbiont of Eucomonympha sp.]|nr:hypothetical protein [Treponema endosymbiont of Eucomonympha sp.]